MKTLKQIIGQYMRLLTVILVVFILNVIVYIQVMNEQRQAYENAARTFQQIEQMLVGNQEEIEEIVAQYSATCLRNAEAIAYIIQNDPSVLESIEELKNIAQLIGVYECNEHMRRVQFTEYVPRIFALDDEETQQLGQDAVSFQHFISSIRKNPVEGEPDTFGVKDRFVKLEEIRDSHETFGVVIDVTESVIKRKEIEAERDMDLLTGLYNRRGMEQKLSALFEKPEELGHSAIVMIDADNLKVINDNYGHDAGSKDSGFNK